MDAYSMPEISAGLKARYQRPRRAAAMNEVAEANPYRRMSLTSETARLTSLIVRWTLSTSSTNSAPGAAFSSASSQRLLAAARAGGRMVGRIPTTTNSADPRASEATTNVARKSVVTIIHPLVLNRREGGCASASSHQFPSENEAQ